ncbi:hypothetical protein [Alkalinema sp. FACHB-956]|uniref:hypothetical protein n=1 Tax=Alkalinema sp. FACHB-956 TaxID=2692768 RepID=UPI0016863699|nr:hypothetical protein [Alkalinema sp. FACHB-956]MBD2327991.1 hypothetical protein [Alkalinema sp. FACHB-956]
MILTQPSLTETSTLSIDRAVQLKQEIIDFIYDAEGEGAIALEQYSARQLKQPNPGNWPNRELLLTRFMVEDQTLGKPPIETFIQHHPALSPAEQQLIRSWTQAIVSLFEITEVLGEGYYQLQNWLTQRSYRVHLGHVASEIQARLQPQEICLVQIAPFQGDRWMALTQPVLLGRLGKPKLAVAIGNFRQCYRRYLYSDAPDLLEESWRSVEKQYHASQAFFGSSIVTLPGRQLNQRLKAFQDTLSDQQLQNAQVNAEEILENAIADAEDTLTETENRQLNSAKASKMVIPPMELPPTLQQAEAVTMLTHPRWGQCFLTSYASLEQYLQSGKGYSIEQAVQAFRKLLNDPAVPVFVFQHLAALYPVAVETLVQQTLEQPDFTLARLNDQLYAMGKPLEPELPDTASVPLHLHELFQEAFIAVSKAQAKKTKASPAKGFKR